MNAYIPNTLEGLYIHGSIALNAFEARGSDIDFITVTNRYLSAEEADLLSKIHKDIARKFKTPEMDGVYMIWEDIGNMENDDLSYFYYNSGRLQFGPYFNCNPVTWTLLAQKGIRIVGPAVSDFELDVSS